MAKQQFLATAEEIALKRLFKKVNQNTFANAINATSQVRNSTQRICIKHGITGIDSDYVGYTHLRATKKGQELIKFRQAALENLKNELSAAVEKTPQAAKTLYQNHLAHKGFMYVHSDKRCQEIVTKHVLQAVLDTKLNKEYPNTLEAKTRKLLAHLIKPATTLGC